MRKQNRRPKEFQRACKIAQKGVRHVSMWLQKVWKCKKMKIWLYSYERDAFLVATSKTKRVRRNTTCQKPPALNAVETTNCKMTREGEHVKFTTATIRSSLQDNIWRARNVCMYVLICTQRYNAVQVITTRKELSNYPYVEKSAARGQRCLIHESEARRFGGSQQHQGRLSGTFRRHRPRRGGGSKS